MKSTGRGARVLAVTGLVAVVVGTLDPLEGSVAILFGVCVLALDAWLGASRHRRALYWSLALTAVGVAALLAMSAAGGVGGRTGRSYWWTVLLLPYPAGWLMGLVGGIGRVREAFTRTAAPGT